METVATRIQETGSQLARQQMAFVSRTREAGETFFGETRDAGRQLVVAFQAEAKRWRRFATQRTALLKAEARTSLSVPAFERALLTQVDTALRGLDARVRARLAALEGKPRKGARKTNQRATRSRKSTRSLPAMAA